VKEIPTMSDLTRNEPVLVATAVTSVAGWGLGELVTHGVITDTQASSATQAVVPAGIAGLVWVLGVIARRFVTPISKVKELTERAGLLTDADWARLEGVIEDKLGVDLDGVATGDEHAVDVGEPVGGMAAGADSDLHVPEHASTEGA
jgi:mRNA-degrading endonuclease toxin of MazEF toxin-antitoxin module